MGKNSGIEWTTHTLNFWIGCQEVSPACDFCYARTQNAFRKWVNGWGPEGERRRTAGSTWHQLRKWNREAGERGIRDKVFSNSLSDFFDNHRGVTIARREAWHYIEQCPNLDFLLLTKRPQNIRKMLPDPETGTKPWGDGWPNVWIGTTVENQEEADRRIPHLLAVPAKVHFLSMEPLLGPVDIDLWLRRMVVRPNEELTDKMVEKGWSHAGGQGDHPPVDWVITGGESGPGARDNDFLTNARSIRDQCHVAGVPVFVKQNVKKAPLPEDLMIKEFPCAA